MRRILIVVLLAALFASALSHDAKHRRTTPSGRGPGGKHHHHGHGGRTTTRKPGAPGGRPLPLPLPLPPPQKSNGSSDAPGACHVCVANGSVHLVAPEYNCSRYFSRWRLTPHVVTLSTCPVGQTFNARTCSCSIPAAADPPCTCSARGGWGGVGVTQLPKPGPTIAAATPSPTESSEKRPCSCVRSRSRFVADLTSGCRDYFEDIGANRTKKHSCSSKKIFNIDKCECDHAEKAKCSCIAATVSPPTTSPTTTPTTSPTNATSCSVGGYTYRPIETTACRNFTVEAAFFPPTVFACHHNFYFDIRACSCVLALRHVMHPMCYDSAWGYPTQSKNQTVHTTPPALPPPGHGCQCVRHGNTYTPINNCSGFEQVAGSTGAHRFTCPAGLLFNVETCVCDRAQNVRNCHVCSAPKPHVPPVRNGCHVCTASGNVYEQIPDTDCRKFSHRSATAAHAAVQTCPGNQRFDPKICVCNHPEEVRCACSINATANEVNSTVIKTAAASSGIGSATNPVRIRPSSAAVGDGRCSCVANGNVYRPIENCSAFTQAQVTTPSKVVRHACPRGLLFSTVSCVCTWPTSTTCHDCSRVSLYLPLGLSVNIL